MIRHGQSVSIIGDSQAAGAPGRELEELLAGAGAQVRRTGRVGQGPASWVNEHRAALAAAATEADHVVLLFGINDASRSADAVRRALTEIQELVRGGTVWYVGPPAYVHIEDHLAGRRIAGLAAQVFGPTFIDSLPFTGVDPSAGRQPDGVHFRNADPWMIGVARALLSW